MSPDDIAKMMDPILTRLRHLEANQRSEVTGGVVGSTVALLPAAGQPRRVRFATDGRKTGEGAGLGTGVLAYDDGTAWRRVDDGTTVVA